MGFLKKLFTGISVLIVAVCAMVLLCALNPGMTQSFSAMLYGTENMDGILSGFLNREEEEDLAETGTRADQTSSQPVTADVTPLAYEVTQESITTLPENVYGRSGYAPIQSSAESVSSAEASRLKTEIGYGPTGSDLKFDEEYYPYYAMLSDNQKSVYKQIYANARAMNASFAPVASIGREALRDTFEALFGDHPELFYVQTAYTEKYTTDNQVVEVDLSYYTLANDLETATNIFEAQAEKIISAARLLPSDYEKEKYVHDAILAAAEYDASAKLSQSAYSTLTDGRSVCAGYSRAFQYILQKLGIPCYYCTGSSGEEHAWNIVKLSDGFYNVDTTWDDTDPATYDYFNKTDADYAGTHVRKSLSVYLPACGGTNFRNLETGAPNGEEMVVENTTNTEGTGYSPYDDPYINNNPTKPLVYDGGSADTASGTGSSTGSGSNTGTGTGTGTGTSGTTGTDTSVTPTRSNAEALSELGLKESDVCWSLTDYYADCLKQLTAAGSGYVTFSNVVPAALFDKIESEYGLGNYKAGFLTKALENIGMNRAQIQIQAQRLGGGYYRLYHNLDTWNEN